MNQVISTLKTSTAIPVLQAPTTVNGGNGRRHRPRRQIRHGRRRAAQKAYTAALLVVVHGMSVAEAIEHCDASTKYFYAMKALHESGNAALLDHVLRGSQSVLVSARKVKNAAAVITAYQKCSGLERELIRLATGATNDAVTMFLNLPSDQLVAVSKALGADWIWTHMIEPAMAASEAPSEVPSKAPSESAALNVA